MPILRPLAIILIAAMFTLPANAADNPRKIVFIAGKRSHGWGSHEHKAGSMLLADRLNKSGLPVNAVVVTEGWPEDDSILDDADAIVMYSDGGANHMALPHVDKLDELAKKGVGIGAIHYAVEVPKGPEAGDKWLDYIGGYFEPHWSVNPHWSASFHALPDHPVANGVRGFGIHDEWYYHMRFRDGMKGITAILTDLPPDSSLARKDGPHSGNPEVRAAVLERKEPQHVMWLYDRSAQGGKGRGFGFTGGHFHWNWGHDQFRKVVLNAIAWIAGVEVPAGGVESATPSAAELEKNQDYPRPENWNSAKIQEQIDAWNAPTPPEDENAASKSKKKANRPDQSDNPSKIKQPEDAVTRAPQDAVSGLDVHPELEATLFAAEPMLLSPSNMDVDHLGRVWIAEVVNYRHFRNKDNPPREAGDRILILEDTDADGRADKQTVFYQGRDIDSAHGVCVLGNKVIVSAGDSVFVLTDEDRDGKADRKDILFTGIGGVQHDHGIHSFHFGPDGKLYFNFGNEGKQIKDRHGNPITDKAGNEVNSSRKPYQEGMIFRCNLDGSEFETLAWNFRNNWELAVDSFGTIWQSDNDDDGNRGVRINFVMEFGNYGYKDEITGAGWREPRTNLEAEIPLQHWHLNDPGVVPNLLQTGAGSPTGILVYEGRLLPEIFHDQMIHTDAGPHIVRSYPVENYGAGYTASIVNIAEGVRDKWFRPSDVTVAPDGSIFVADWYDPGVGGHAQGDIDRGRVFRIAPPGIKHSVPSFDFTTIDGAIAALKSPNHAARYLAWIALHEVGAEAEPALKKMFDAEQNPRFRARALWLLSKLDSGTEHIDAALKDEDADIRITALRAARQIDADTLAIVKRLVNDPSPQVRRECAVALRHITTPEAAELWAKLARQHDGNDRWYLEALGIGSDLHADACYEAYMQTVPAFTPAMRDVLWRLRSTKVLPLFAELITDPKTPPDERLRYFRAFDFHPREATRPVLMALLDASGPHAAQISALALKHLGNIDLAQHPDARAAVERAVGASKGTPQFISLVTQFQMRDQIDELMRLALTNPNQTLGVDAAKAVMKFGEADRFKSIIEGDDSARAAAALTVLGYTGERDLMRLLMQVARDGKQPMPVRQSAIDAFGRSREGEKWLLGSVKNGNFPPELSIAAANVLHSSQDAQIREEAAKHIQMPAAANSKPLPPIAELAKRKGDAAAGQAVFMRTCQICHKVGQTGIEFGPNLGEVGSKLAREDLYRAIIDPNAAVSFGFEGVLITTRDGSQRIGYITSETPTEVTLRMMGGIDAKIPAADVAKRQKQPASLMLPNLQQTMTEQELIDLVEYLASLKTK